MESGELVPAGYGDGQIGLLLKRIAHRDTILTVEPHLHIFGAYADIDGKEMKHRFHFQSNGEAFDMAVASLRRLMQENNC